MILLLAGVLAMVLVVTRDGSDDADDLAAPYVPVAPLETTPTQPDPAGLTASDLDGCCRRTRSWVPAGVS